MKTAQQFFNIIFVFTVSSLTIRTVLNRTNCIGYAAVIFISYRSNTTTLLGLNISGGFAATEIC